MHGRVPSALIQRLIVALAVLTATGCHRPLAVPSVAGASVELFDVNRCADGGAQPCLFDRECDGGQCVSVLVSDHGGFGRDGGHTVAVGERVLWLFGDTFTAAGLRSFTAGWSDNRNPLRLSDVADMRAPLQFVPFTPAEERFNYQHRSPASCCRQQEGCEADQPYCHCPPATDCASRVALWPGDGVASGDGATILYERYVIGVAPFDFRYAGVGLASVRGRNAAAERVKLGSDPLMLFTADEPNFARGVAGHGDDRGYFYLFGIGQRAQCVVDVLSARVPIDRLPERDAYRFWDGSDWRADLAAAQPVAAAIVGGLGSVSWNDHLQSYLSVWSDLCTQGRLVLRTAPRPQGPWSTPIMINLDGVGADARSYYGWAHPEFGADDQLLVSFFQPLGEMDGQLRLIRLHLP